MQNRRVAVLTCLQCYRPFFFADRAAQEQLDAAAPRDGTSDPTWPQKVSLTSVIGALGSSRQAEAPICAKPAETPRGVTWASHGFEGTTISNL